MAHKRLRDDDEAISTTDIPARKKQATEKSASTSAAERRQLRSERKSKKVQQVKNNVKIKKRAAGTGLEDAPGFVAADASAREEGDSLAGGQDFVPLVAAISDASTQKGGSGGLNNGVSISNPNPKKKSPRNERKEQKVAKAGKAAEEEFGTSEKNTEQSSGKTRFICFVGNLPYTVTKEQIQQHFRKLSPASIRLSTDKVTGRPKGFAFLEFDDYSAMRTCLKIYHHSIFDPERTTRLGDDAFDKNVTEIQKPGQQARQTGRRINVELTAGGGGNKEGRKEKIKGKNQKLAEERERRKETEMKQERSKLKKKQQEQKSDANSTDIGTSEIHPSRLRQVKQ